MNPLIPRFSSLCLNLRAAFSPLNRARRDLEAELPQVPDILEDLVLICQAKVPPDLPPLDVLSADAVNDLDLIPHLLEHPHLGIQREPGEDPGGMVVVPELPPELQVQLVEEPRPLKYLLDLNLEVSLGVESFPDQGISPSRSIPLLCH
jgi:hypothetical protein